MDPVQHILLGRLVKGPPPGPTGSTGPGAAPAYYKISAIWICPTDSEPSVALTPHYFPGSVDASGPVVIDFLSNLVMA